MQGLLFLFATPVHVEPASLGAFRTTIVATWLFVALSEMGMPNIALADAGEGELFGYKIGEHIEVSPLVKIPTPDKMTGALRIDATRREISTSWEDHWIVITPKSHKVMSIHAKTEFESNDEMKAFFRRFRALLVERYSEEAGWTPRERDPSISLRRGNGKYQFQLASFFYVPLLQEPSVKISLYLTEENRRGLSDLVQDELEALRIEQARQADEGQGL